MANLPGVGSHQLGEQVGLHKSHVSLLEAGFAHPVEATARLLAEALGVDFGEFWASVEESRLAMKGKKTYEKRGGRGGKPMGPIGTGRLTLQTNVPIEMMDWLEAVGRRDDVSAGEVSLRILETMYADYLAAKEWNAEQTRRVAAEIAAGTAIRREPGQPVPQPAGQISREPGDGRDAVAGTGAAA